MMTNKNNCKKIIFSYLKLAPSHAILVSNTSSFLIGNIGKLMKRRTNIGGLHFFAPVPLSRVVEIIRCAETTEATYESIKQFAITIGKEYVICKDTTGFVVNSVLSALIFTAIKMVENGIAEAVDIDKAVKLALGHQTGPLELADYLGLDVLNSSNQSFHAAQPLNPLYFPGLLANKVAEGKLGRKSGEGFYKYSSSNQSKL